MATKLYVEENKFCVMKKYIAAIDLGTSKVVTLIGEKMPSGKIHVVAHCEAPSKGVTRGEVLNMQEVEQAVLPTVEEVKRQTGLEFSEVYVGVAGQHTRCLSDSFNVLRKDNYAEISEEEIKQLEHNMFHTPIAADEEILHVLPQNYNVDDHMGIINPVGMLGRKLEANFRVFVGRKSSTEHTKRAIERMKMTMKQVVLEPLASSAAVLHDEEKEMGVAMIDIGAGTTDLIIYYDKIVRYSAVIPFGGNVISEDIRKGCGILPRQAEQLKIQYGSCYGDLAVDNKIITIPGVCGRESREVSFKLLAQIIESRMEEIIEAVMYEIEQSGYGDKLHAGIVLTGGGATLEHLPEFMRYKTGLDIRRGKPIFLTSDSSEELNLCSYATAVGLLMKGFEHEEELEQPVSTATLHIPEIVPEPIPVESAAPVSPVATKKVKPPKEPKSKENRSGMRGIFDGFFNLDNEV